MYFEVHSAGLSCLFDLICYYGALSTFEVSFLIPLKESQNGWFPKLNPAHCLRGPIGRTLDIVFKLAFTFT